MSYGEISLYDKDVKACKALLQGMKPRELSGTTPWHPLEKEALVLRSDMAYELGGSGQAAVSGLAFTTDPGLVPESGIFLIGQDLPGLKEDMDYARLTFLRLRKPGEDLSVGAVRASENSHNAMPARLQEPLENSRPSRIHEDPQVLYGLLRKLDYTRYHIFPEGYMMRISAASQREPVRISREALRAGMDFAGVGACFAEGYLAHPQVCAVQTYFITDPHANYVALQGFARRFEEITGSMNLLFKGLSMDCSTCGQRQICEEIDGLKELHQSLLYNL